MIRKFKTAMEAKYMALYALMCMALTGVVMSGLFPEDAAAAKYKAPCNNTLSKPLSAVINPIAGAFIGLKPLFFVIGLASFLVGGLLSLTEFGRNLVKYSLVIGGVLLAFGAVTSFADAMGLANGC
jgi:hypothetical protein